MKISPLIITLCFFTHLHAMDNVWPMTKDDITTNATNPAQKELDLDQQVSAMSCISRAWLIIQEKLSPYVSSKETLSLQTIITLEEHIEGPINIITEYATSTSPIELQQHALAFIEGIITSTLRGIINQQIKNLLCNTIYNITTTYLDQENGVPLDVANQGFRILSSLIRLDHKTTFTFAERFIHFLYEKAMRHEETPIIPGDLYLIEAFAEKISRTELKDPKAIDLCEKMLILTTRYCQHTNPEVVALSLRSIKHFILLLPQATRYANDALHASHTHEAVKNNSSVQKMIAHLHQTITMMLAYKAPYPHSISVLPRSVSVNSSQTATIYSGPTTQIVPIHVPHHKDVRKQK